MIMAVISPLALGLAGCADSTAPAPFAPEYRGIETRLLDGDLVNFHVSMGGARDALDVERYAECAAAQYALIRGYGFARHLRTSVSEEAGIWQGDAVYTISAALPRGLMTIDAEVVAANCAENGIPMV
ncbi:MAG: hypothetical protein KBT70_01230 [Roseovarius sp.]|jgi:hypothetical protein|uniref:hypothetical protein n=1 Tax=Roseovarius sp. TaxID=1486281 RepID=UPI001B6DB18A|nr:hypothetical protein [Roseovarius sp.]MBQ0748795.1 hypothetical protein [Roseovarius sp.]MBQ0808761.1 hypothetical protein [Roseovarius sp.]